MSGAESGGPFLHGFCDSFFTGSYVSYACMPAGGGGLHALTAGRSGGEACSIRGVR